MAYDIKHEFSKDQAVTATAASTNVIDLGSGKDAQGLTRIRDIGQGEELHIHIRVTEAVTASQAATVAFALEGADDEDFNTNKVSLAQIPATAKTALTLGKKLQMVVPPENQKRYMRLYYTVDTGPLNKGKFTAWLGGRA